MTLNKTLSEIVAQVEWLRENTIANTSVLEQALLEIEEFEDVDYPAYISLMRKEIATIVQEYDIVFPTNLGN